MTTQWRAGETCNECGGPVAEAWQTTCDWCYEAIGLEACNCYHDERDQCICYDQCPYFDTCPAWEAPLFADVYGRSSADVAAAEAGQAPEGDA